MGKMDEQILVVNRKILFDDEKLVFQGTLLKDGDGHIGGQSIIDNLMDNYEVMRRGDAEENAEYKQPIPYAVIRKGDKIFTYKRLIGGGEVRLHDKLSIGVGGHMNDLSEEEKKIIEGISFMTILTDNLERELSEELFISTSEREAEIIGLINDDSNDVGKVHIGVLIVIDVSADAEVDVLEKEQLEGGWLQIAELIKPETYEKLENWSKIAINALI